MAFDLQRSSMNTEKGCEIHDEAYILMMIGNKKEGA